MKTCRNITKRLFALSLMVSFLAATLAQGAKTEWPAKTAAIPLEQVGAVASAQYTGDGLAVSATSQGAHLRCVFQKMEGEATREGLWVTSTAPGGGKFRLVASAVSRSDPFTPEAQSSISLPATGTVSVEGQRVLFTRPGLVEEYSVSLDGVRQDFIIPSRPLNPQPSTLNASASDLQVCLQVTGARVGKAPGGAQLVLEQSGRKIAYSRLRATDAAGRELPARVEVPAKSEIRDPKSEISLAVVVDDADAVYPVRIDPTFSDANWISLGGIPGANGPVSAMVLDGSGNLYIGGSFGIIGDVFANGIAKWDGSSWSALGSGINGSVYALAVSGSNLYAGGNFMTAGRLAITHVVKWDGSNWSALGSGLGSGPYESVYALAVSGGDVYAGGTELPVWSDWCDGYVAKWDGKSWSALGSGLYDCVYALAVSGGDVYAGGARGGGWGSEEGYVAKWNGGSWSDLGWMDGVVSALAVSGSNLYAAGWFATAGGVAANCIAKCDGSNWSALGSGLNYSVSALAVADSGIYAAGGYSGIYGSDGYVTKWDGSSWSDLVLGMNDSVAALAVSGGDLYVGGLFTTAGGTPASHIAKWDGRSWSALGSGSGLGIGGTYSPTVYALAASGSDVYAGGWFAFAGSTPVNGIAKWDGSCWSALGSGLTANDWLAYAVYALAVSGSNVYAAGEFVTAGGVAATNIARWDGSSWSALGAGIGSSYYGSVRALAVSGSNVYAGGYFTNAGGIVTSNIATWDGTRWSALGSGITDNYGSVHALAASGSDLYAGGSFTTAGGIAAKSIAKWDGTSWSALDSGINGSVEALAVSGSNVYAGGYFTTAGSNAAAGVAKWDGNSWSALGSGITENGGSVYALAVSGSNVYAGGEFTIAGGTVARNIAKWDGTSWSALGSGINGSVWALAVSGSELLAEGYFTTAGGKVSPYVAKAIVNPGNWLTLRYGVPGPHTNTLSYVGVPDAQYLIQFATNLTTSPWFTLTTNAAAANGRGTLQDPAATDTQRFYRVGALP